MMSRKFETMIISSLLMISCLSEPETTSTASLTAAKSNLEIVFDQVPSCYVENKTTERDMENVTGRVEDLDKENSYQIVLYAETNYWWVQPYATAPFTDIDGDNAWNSRIHLGYRYGALLVKPSFTPDSETLALPEVGGKVVAKKIVPCSP